jgi:hypothetical protein
MKKDLTLSTTHASPAGAPTTEQRGQAVQVVGAGNLHDAEQGAEFGTQLTDQYRKAVGGMTEVLRFGAMMMWLNQNLSALGQVSKGGRGNKDGVSEWLRVFAPDVKKSTAYRFLHVAEAVARDFQLPAKVSFIELATTEFSQLPEKLQQKQSELWEYVNGTSQRSWLDRFSPPNPATLHRLHPANAGANLPPPSPEEVEKVRREEVLRTFSELDKIIDRSDWHYLTDDQIRLGIDIFSDWVTKAKAYVAIPRHERTARKLKALAAK